jgi:hypothetical protein
MSMDLDAMAAEALTLRQAESACECEQTDDDAHDFCTHASACERVVKLSCHMVPGRMARYLRCANCEEYEG